MTFVSRRKQLGYLYGVPVGLALMGMALAIIVPLLPPTVAKVLVVAGAVIASGALYYLLVAPGWLPERPAGMGRMARLATFLAVALLLLAGAATFVMGES